MNVNKLIAILATLDQDTEVLFATDEEGNGYGTLDAEVEKADYESADGSKPVYILYPRAFVNPDDVS